MLVESSKISEMQHWYQALPGSMLHTIEMRHLNRYLPRLYGQFALQIGGLESLVMLERSPIPNKIFLFESFCSNTLGHNLKADLTQLPLAPNSLDLMLLPHVLEFCDDPKQLLSQCYQALAPFGHLLILSFLPLSLWGLWRLGNRCQGIPW